jgi:hypothetical protein
MTSNEVTKDFILGSLIPLIDLQVFLMCPSPHQVGCLCWVVVVGWGFPHLGVLVGGLCCLSVPFYNI